MNIYIYINICIYKYIYCVYNVCHISYIFLSVHTYSHRFVSITFNYIHFLESTCITCFVNLHPFTSTRNLASVDVTLWDGRIKRGLLERFSDLTSNDRGSKAPIESLWIHTTYVWWGRYLDLHLCTFMYIYFASYHLLSSSVTWNILKHTICIGALAVALLLAEDLDCVYGCVRVLSAMRWPQKANMCVGAILLKRDTTYTDIPCIRKPRTVYYVGLPSRTHFKKMLEIYIYIYRILTQWSFWVEYDMWHFKIDIALD